MTFRENDESIGQRSINNKNPSEVTGLSTSGSLSGASAVAVQQPCALASIEERLARLHRKHCLLANAFGSLRHNVWQARAISKAKARFFKRATQTVESHPILPELNYRQYQRLYKDNRKMWVKISPKDDVIDSEHYIFGDIYSSDVYVQVKHLRKRQRPRIVRDNVILEAGDPESDEAPSWSMPDDVRLDYTPNFGNAEIIQIMIFVVIFYRARLVDKGLLAALVFLQAKGFDQVQIDTVISLLDSLGCATMRGPLVVPKHKFEQRSPYDPPDLQSGDVQTDISDFFKLMTSLVSNRGVKDVLLVLFGLISIFYASTTGSPYTTEVVRMVDMSAHAIEQTCGSNSIPTRILNGITQFFGVLKIFAQHGFKGVRMYLNPFNDIASRHSQAIELQTNIGFWQTLNNTQKQRTKALYVDLNDWVNANIETMKAVSRDKSFSYASQQFSTIQRAVMAFRNQNICDIQSSSIRAQPFCMALVGGSSIGKSTLQIRLCQLIMRAAGIEGTSEELNRMIYNWDPSQKHANGLTAEKEAVVLDDISALHSKIEELSGGPVIAHLLKLCNVWPFIPEQAAIENKGNIPCHPKAVLLSSNIEGMSLDAVFKVPDVVKRRIQLYCRVRVASEYATPSNTLDYVKAAQWNESEAAKNGEIEPFWEVNALEYVVENHFDEDTQRTNISGGYRRVFPTQEAVDKSVEEKKPSIWGSMQDFCAFTYARAKAHHTYQGDMVKNVLNRDVKFEFPNSVVEPSDNGVAVPFVPHVFEDPNRPPPRRRNRSRHVHFDEEIESGLQSGDIREEEISLFAQHRRNMIPRQEPTTREVRQCDFKPPPFTPLRERLMKCVRSAYEKTKTYASAGLAVGVTLSPFLLGFMVCVTTVLQLFGYGIAFGFYQYMTGGGILTSITSFLYACVTVYESLISVGVTHFVIGFGKSMFGYIAQGAPVSVKRVLHRTATYLRCGASADFNRAMEAAFAFVKRNLAMIAWITMFCIGFNYYRGWRHAAENESTEAQKFNAEELRPDIRMRTYGENGTWHQRVNEAVQEQGAAASNDEIPRYQAAPIAGLPVSEMSRTTDHQSFVSLLTDNIATLKFCWVDKDGVTKILPTRGLYVTSNLIVCNAHTFDAIADPKVVLKVEPWHKKYAPVQFEIEVAGLYHAPGTDLTFIRASKTDCKRKDISGFFLDRIYHGHAAVRFLGADALGVFSDTAPLVAGGRVRTQEAYRVRIHDNKTGLTLTTQKGDCGTPYYDSSKAVVYGIHMAVEDGQSGRKVMQPVTQQHIRDAVAHYTTGTTQGLVIPMHNVDPTLVTKVHEKSVVNWLKAPEQPLPGPVHMVVVSGYGGHRSNPTSKIVQGLLYPSISRMNVSEYFDKFDCGKVPPRFGDLDCRKAQFLALVPLVTQPDIDLALRAKFRECGDMYMFRLDHNTKWQQHMQVLSEDEAINGIDGLRGFDALNWNTSCGFPWYKSKKYLFSEENGRKVMCAELAESVRTLEQRLRRGKHFPVFSTQLKDEVISLKKLEQRKYRVFMASPVDFTIVVRKYLLCIARVMQLYPYTFGAAVGMNATSIQWNDLAEFLGRSANYRIFDGDYADFDKNMRSDITQAVHQVIYEMVLLSEVHKDDLNLVNNILTVIFNPVVNYFGTLIRFPSLNPSGNSLTTQINCIANNLFVRYAFVEAHFAGKYSIEATLTFERVVRVMTYGDDLLVGVKPGFDFSCRTMQEHLGKIAITFTDAQKNLVAQPYSTWDEVTFLKRRFEWHQHGDKQLCHCPLDKLSIVKMLQYTSKNAQVSDIEILQSTLQSVATESHLHGHKFFQFMSSLVGDALDEVLPGSRDELGFKLYAFYELRFIESHDSKYSYDDPLAGDYNPTDVHSSKIVDGHGNTSESDSEQRTRVQCAQQ